MQEVRGSSPRISTITLLIELNYRFKYTLLDCITDKQSNRAENAPTIFI